MDKKNLHRTYMSMAYRYASKSKDPSTQVGAVLVHPEYGLIEGSYNHIPENLQIHPSRWERPNKEYYVEHAERNVIYNAAKKGIICEGLTLYCTWPCCSACARAIIQSGISKVVGHKKLFDLTPERWKTSINKAMKMLDEAGVDVEWWSGKVKHIEIRFDKKTIKP